ncbi:hypothetical protein WG947_15715 [Pontibacter sp. H259]|uniref:hypothetical protein n=1 Tax=Pontibacter sp. H259 TaxID=3133421 RepID=UPI0030BCB575
MIYKSIKYTLLGILATLALYQISPIGDYCLGLGTAVVFFLFSGLFIIFFVIFLAIDSSRKIKKGKKFDYVPSVIFTVFLVCSIILIQMRDKFWTSEELIGFVEDDKKKYEEAEGTIEFESEYDKPGKLILYKNGTFQASVNIYSDVSCYYSGDYIIENKMLTLKREGLEQQTNKVFTTQYRIVDSESLLMPLVKGFGKIAIEKTSLNEQ